MKPTLTAFFLLLAFAAGAAPGDSEIARWKDNRNDVFLLMFSDS